MNLAKEGAQTLLAEGNAVGIAVHSGVSGCGHTLVGEGQTGLQTATELVKGGGAALLREGQGSIDAIRQARSHGLHQVIPPLQLPPLPFPLEPAAPR